MLYGICVMVVLLFGAAVAVTVAKQNQIDGVAPGTVSPDADSVPTGVAPMFEDHAADEVLMRLENMESYLKTIQRSTMAKARDHESVVQSLRVQRARGMFISPNALAASAAIPHHEKLVSLYRDRAKSYGALRAGLVRIIKMQEQVIEIEDDCPIESAS